jgi:hypothetical protein
MENDKFRREAQKCAQLAARQLAGSREREEWPRIAEEWRASARNAAFGDGARHELTASGTGTIESPVTCAQGSRPVPEHFPDCPHLRLFDGRHIFSGDDD